MKFKAERLCKLLGLAVMLPRHGLAQSSISPIIVNNKPADITAPLLEAFVSYSIEFAFFPDFAGISLQQLDSHHH